MTAARLLLPAGLALLAACAQNPANVDIEPDAQKPCKPIALHVGQTLTLTLPSNPTTGFRWQVQDAAPSVLRSLGPEVYSTPEDAGMVGGAGQSSWRFLANLAGEGRLLLTYQRPWETDVAPEKRVECQVSVQ
ncbi:Chagasin family peptidase inhibitor I42 [compost metagenome]